MRRCVPIGALGLASWKQPAPDLRGNCAQVRAHRHAWPGRTHMASPGPAGEQLRMAPRSGKGGGTQ
eukprot:12882270-Prorocentrum_lima.AAC.1